MGHRQGPPPPRIDGGKIRSWDHGDAAWWRVYHLDYQNPTALHRRTFGPLARFDHHQLDAARKPREDPDRRSVIYLGDSRKTAAAEVFWDQERLPGDPDELHVARVCRWHRLVQLRPKAPIQLLSLLDGDGDDIGVLPELSTGPTAIHPLAQEWARAIYRDLEEACGILYRGAHEYGDCIALWDRGGELEVVPDRDVPLHADGVWERVLAEYESRTRTMVKIESSDCSRCRELGLR